MDMSPDSQGWTKPFSIQPFLKEQEKVDRQYQRMDHWFMGKKKRKNLNNETLVKQPNCFLKVSREIYSTSTQIRIYILIIYTNSSQ